MDKPSITRLISLIVGLLAYFGVNVPSTISEAIVGIVVGLVAIYTAWKNNNLTKEAQDAQAYLDGLKEQKKQNK